MQDRDINIFKECGFTLIELIISMALVGMVSSMVIKGLLSNHSIFLEDTIRTRMNGNIRISMDIIGTNIRQGGENLTNQFPAIIVENGNNPSNATLSVRRSLVSEVLTLCSDINVGATTLPVSDNSNLDPECLGSSVDHIQQVFENMRLKGIDKVFLYNKVTKIGEFVNFEQSNIDSGIYSIKTSPITKSYSRMSANIYLLEEMKYSVNPITKTLEIAVNGNYSAPEALAFDVGELGFKVTLRGDAEVYTLNELSAHNWTLIKNIEVSINGVEQTRHRTVTSKLKSQFLPRNTLS